MSYIYKRIILLLKIYQPAFVNHFQIFKYSNAVIFCLLLQSFSLNNTYLVSDDRDNEGGLWNVPALAPQCSPISSLICPDLVQDLNLRFNFKSSYGGLRDRNGIATVFTIVDKPSKPRVTPTYSTIPG